MQINSFSDYYQYDPKGQLIPSVPPLVKIISSGLQLIKELIYYFESSIIYSNKGVVA